MILYRTVKKEATAEQVIEKSRFISHIKPVSTREEADAFIAQMKKKYKDATHNVPAMVIGDKKQIQWGSDDGEPQGTSGAPIVQMLVKEDITNVVIVVTRYFGGIKLGTGGLVRAYTSSAKLALEAATICEVVEVTALTVEMEYTYLQRLQNLSNNENFLIANIKYTEKIVADLLTEPENVDNIMERVAGITNGTAKLIEKNLSKTFK